MSILEKAMEKMRANKSEHKLVAAIPADSGTQVAVAGGHEAITLLACAIGTIALDDEVLQEAQLLDASPAGRELAQQFRVMRRLILKTAQSDATSPAADHRERNRMIMVASALAGDGKSFTAFNLAVTLSARKDQQVLLVDCDIAKPHLSTALKLQRKSGLIEALQTEGASIENYILATSRNNLFFLPAGTRTETAPELLDSARMWQLFKQLLHRFPHLVIVFDSSPVLLTSEARALAVVCGQAVLVVRSGETPRHAVQEAGRILSADVAHTWVVLNGVSHLDTADYYGYGFPYAYGDNRNATGSVAS